MYLLLKNDTINTFKLWQKPYNHTRWLSHTDYMSKEDYPYEYVGKEGIIELYEKILAQYE